MRRQRFDPKHDTRFKGANPRSSVLFDVTSLAFLNLFYIDSYPKFFAGKYDYIFITLESTDSDDMVYYYKITEAEEEDDNAFDGRYVYGSGTMEDYEESNEDSDEEEDGTMPVFTTTLDFIKGDMAMDSYKCFSLTLKCGKHVKFPLCYNFKVIADLCDGQLMNPHPSHTITPEDY